MSNESIEDAAREAIRDGANLSDPAVACQLHAPATVIHLTKDPCPLCTGLDPVRLVEALHALVLSPAPVGEVLEAIVAMKPFTAQLGGREITAFGHTVADVVRLGGAQKALEDWLNRTAPLETTRRAFASLTDGQREEILNGFCRHCLRPTGPEDRCNCWNDE